MPPLPPTPWLRPCIQCMYTCKTFCVIAKMINKKITKNKYLKSSDGGAESVHKSYKNNMTRDDNHFLSRYTASLH